MTRETVSASRYVSSLNFDEQVGRRIRLMLEETGRPVMIKDVTPEDADSVHLEIEAVDG